MQWSPTGKCETRLSSYANFHSVPATAEATTLAEQSVDYVVAGQAFHWFQVSRTREEFARILRTGGWVVLMWNSRRTDATPFLHPVRFRGVLHGPAPTTMDEKATTNHAH